VTTAVRLPPVLLGAVIVHTAVAPQLRLFGVSADLLLLFAIAAGIATGADRGAAVGFGAGLLADCFLQTPFGLSALTYSLIAYGVGSFQSTILHTGRWIPMLTTLVASALGVALFSVSGLVLGEEHLLSTRLVTVAAVVAVVNALLSPLAVRLVRWAVTPQLVPGAVMR
jgi:rod shape-determining protein MreD